MPSYSAPVADYKFLLYEFLGVERYGNLPGFEDLTPDLTDALLEESGKFVSEVLHPLNMVGDEEGCRLQDGVVTTPTGFKDAFKQFSATGIAAITADPDYGGQGMPNVLGVCLTEMTSSANMAFGMYSGLSMGAYKSIHYWGTEAQKKTYLPKLVSGEWTGTMNLTEPHCGTDLGLLRTKAVPIDDDAAAGGEPPYAITGTKIFISAGEHDLAENIIHLVLARLPDAPQGIRGISLFVVPKFHINADGGLGERNGVLCTALEQKMGIHGNSTCVLNYDGAVGYLLGEPHKGMRAMFTMMNEARLGVALQGLGQSEIAYQNAAIYARERLQGRSLAGVKAPDQIADPIIVHPDVRRMLMRMRAFNEGARALALWAGLQTDIAHGHPDERARRDADDFMALLTPVLKAYFTDLGFENANAAMQCFGGHGYIRETGVEQFVRDARIAQIYEGANGVQALDLVGRKLPDHMGRPLRQFFHPLDSFIRENAGNKELSPFVTPLAQAFGRLQSATSQVALKGMSDFEEAGAASSDYLRLFALVALGFVWARMAKLAMEKLANDPADPAFYERKVKTARFFFDRMLPETAGLLSMVLAGKDSMMAFAEEDF